ncbi:MAG: CDP-diacylglycerol--serine O-phosphatidyltransferase [Alphaproteobacteria bacterium]
MLRKSAREVPVRLKQLPFKHIIPNMVTLFALASGITSIRFAAQGRWEAAVIAIFIAAVLDGLDGRVARMLRGTSKFGAELDSLCDFLSFGVAPAIILYFWTPWGGVYPGWVISILYSMSCALRLARFNTMLEDENPPPYWGSFFVGVPAPAGAILSLTPIMLYFHLGFEFLRAPVVVGIVLIVCSGLMVSQIPTFSVKKLKIPVFLVIPLFLITTIVAGFIISQPWVTISLLALAYSCSIPVSVIVFMKKKKKFEALEQQVSELEQTSETVKS